MYTDKIITPGTTGKALTDPDSPGKWLPTSANSSHVKLVFLFWEEKQSEEGQQRTQRQEGKRVLVEFLSVQFFNGLIL